MYHNQASFIVCMCEVPWLAGRSHSVLTRKICLACMGDCFQLSSDFVTSASWFPNKYKNLKNIPKDAK